MMNKIDYWSINIDVNLRTEECSLNSDRKIELIFFFVSEAVI